MLAVSRWRVIAVLAATVWAILFALPNFLPESVRESMPGFLPRQAVNLGLDFQGGSHLLLEVDDQSLFNERLENLAEDMGRVLGEAEPRIQFTGRGVVDGYARLRVLSPEQQAEALREIRGLAQPVNPGALGGGGLDLVIEASDDGSIRATLSDDARRQMVTQAVAQSIEVLRRRIDPSGTSEITIVRQGADRIVVQAPGESDPEDLKRRIGQTAKMTFHLVDDGVSLQDIVEGRAPPGTEILPQDDPREPLVAVRRRAILTGENLTNAFAGFHPQSQQPIVNFRFDARGAEVFCKLTNQYTGRRFATVLDGQVITAPRINEPICGGSGLIEGNFTTESSAELALLLRSGALPAPLTVLEQRTVGAELGADAIQAGALSGLIAAAAVLVFMVLAYGLFGLIACVALILNLVMILAAMSTIGAALTLPGIAGLILTMAMAVDANVLIYERMRDEQALGRGPAIAADAGFNRALVTIVDANLTTILAAVILFVMGRGPVQGFAWTLFIGVITSVFTAVLVTQILIATWFRANRPKKLPI